MNGAGDPLEWANRAEEDYQLARISLNRKLPLTYGATFHAQQSAEKYIKALLTLRQIAFPHTHDLAALNN
ncbi:MAG: HEPN domain-containing protein, partial [Anaerolineales bacterium]